MNWAHRLLKYTPELKPVVASPLIVKNEFYDPEISFIWSPFQVHVPKDEWQVASWQRWLNYAVHFSGLYQAWLIHRLKKENCQVLHIHFANVACRYLEVSKKLKIPLVVTFHGFDYETFVRSKPHYRKLYQKLFLTAAAITCGGPAGKARIVKLGCPEEKIHIIRMAIDPTKIPVHNRQKETNQLRMLQAGTITEKKGHLYTINAFIKAAPNCPNLHLTILGEQENKEITNQLKQLIQESQMQDRIIFKEILPYEEFIEFSNDFDVFIHPSCEAQNGDCEGGTPLVMQDMMATGMPIISTNHADIQEGVLHQKTGWISEEKDINDIAKGIQFFYEMEDPIYQNFAKNAREHMLENYHVAESGKQLATLYKSLID